jgi:hypothetical protein
MEIELQEQRKALSDIQQQIQHKLSVNKQLEQVGQDFQLLINIEEILSNSSV